jgi:RimJ/RimL family protein N-acetyltransferase
MALIEPIVVATKYGQRATLRCPDEEDAEALLTMMHAVFEDGAGMPVTFDEMPILSVDQERAWIRARRDGPNEIFVLAEVGGTFAGNVRLQTPPRKRLVHVATLAITLTPPFRGLGIGDALMKVALDWARAHPRIEKVDLRVLSDNERAIGLYRKYGFVVEGRLARAIRYEDGRYVDAVLMARDVSASSS